MEINNRDDILQFLKDITLKIENKQINEQEMQLLGEFYISFKFRENFDKELNEELNKEISDEDMIKFLILGWYIYFMIRMKK